MTSDVAIEDVLEALAGGPVDELDLIEALGHDVADGPLLDDRRLVHLADDRVAHGRLLVEGLVAWHRISEEEARTRTIELDHDALLLAIALADPLTASVGDEQVELRIPQDDAGDLDPDRGPLLDLPDTWAPDLAPGDLLGYAADDDHLAVVLGPMAGEQPADPEPAAVAGLRRALEAVGAAHRQPLLLAGSPDEDEAPDGAWVLHLDEVGTLLLADHPDAVRALDRPLSEVAADGGLRVVDGTVLGPDVSEQDLALYALGRAVILDAYPAETLEPGAAEAAGLAFLALTGDTEAEVLDPNAAVVLADPLVAEALARRMWDLPDDEVGLVRDRARALAGRDPSAPGPGLVLAEAHLRDGAIEEACDLLARLVVGPPPPDGEEWAAIHQAHGDMCAYAGDVAGAQAAFRRTGEDGLAEQLQRWRPAPPAGVGRNDRCPCGSGRKAKQCCLLHPPAPDLADRVPFAWWKLERACLHIHGRDLPWTDATSPLVPAAVADAHLVEDGALADVSAWIGPLLPADERELVAGWAGAARGLHQVEEVAEDGVTVRDLVTDAVAVVVPDRHEAPPVLGDLWLAVLVAGPGGRTHTVGPVLRPPPPARAVVVEVLAAGPDGQQVADLVSALLG